MKQKLNCILLIDDDEPTNFISSMLLEEADCAHHIQIEESAQRALEYLSKTRPCSNENGSSSYPELVFLDINMPAMNGWEFLETCNDLKMNLLPGTVIIMLTTSINPDDSMRAGNIPLVAGFESKPLTSSMIQRVLKKYFKLEQETETCTLPALLSSPVKI
ncbi:MAG: response regulator [Ferruginibacter sp.]